MGGALLDLHGVRLLVVRHGEVSERIMELAVRVLGTVYLDAPRRPDYVELHLYGCISDYAAMRGGKPEYPAMHEAYLGYPRIHVVEELLPRGREEALMTHEAVHSVLHGSSRFYEVEVGVRIAELYGARLELALTHAASAIKDVEVAYYQAERSMEEMLRLYAEYLLEISVEDLLEAAALASGRPDAEERRFFLVLLSKRLAPLPPLLNGRHTGRMHEALYSYLSHYPEWVRKGAQRLVGEVLPRLRWGDLSRRIEELLLAASSMAG